MTDAAAFGVALGERFGVRDAPVLITSAITKTKVAVTLVESDAAVSVLSDPLLPDNAFLVHFNIRPCPDHELWLGNRAVGRCSFGAGQTAIHDLREPPRALVHTPMGCMMFYLSRSLLDEIDEEEGSRSGEELYLEPGVSVEDSTVRQLSEVLYAALQQPERANSLFVDHVTIALALHVAETYGTSRQLRSRAQGGLAPWQERRAKELIASRLDGNVSLEMLAAACGVSRSQFARSFRRSVGEPPYRWLLRQRVERAKTLMRETALSLSEVAIASGFCDQSHLTRCFRSFAGVSPGVWQRHYGRSRP